MASPTITRRLSIEGKVQGVGYRASFADQATLLDVIGWVRNRRDGGVEALVRGTSDSVQAMIDWSRTGPPGARVASVKVIDENESVHIPPAFRIAATE